MAQGVGESHAGIANRDRERGNIRPDPALARRRQPQRREPRLQVLEAAHTAATVRTERVDLQGAVRVLAAFPGTRPQPEH